MIGGAILAARSPAAAAVWSPTPRIEVFAHRGASALRPEHTLAAYAKAIEDGADFVEPDLVISRDGVLVVRHEPNIAETTDVARHPEFASRRTEKVIDGVRQTGWFVEDFTLAELKTLRAIERLPKLRPANAALDGKYGLVTWPEMADFVGAAARRTGRSIGLVPELKHSTYFASIGLPLEDRFLASLGQGYARVCPLVIQSFETGNLKYLRRKLGRQDRLRLMQLIDPGHAPADIVATGGSAIPQSLMRTPRLRDIAVYADILGPDTRSIIPLDPDGRLGAPTSVVADAHAVGLQVVPWTFRPENYFLAADFQDEAGPSARNQAGSIAEMQRYLKTGINGFFTDDPKLGRVAIGRSHLSSPDAKRLSL